MNHWISLRFSSSSVEGEISASLPARAVGAQLLPSQAGQRKDERQQEAQKRGEAANTDKPAGGWLVHRLSALNGVERDQSGGCSLSLSAPTLPGVEPCGEG